MRSSLFIRGFALLLAASALTAAPAAAAGPTVFELPAATHAKNVAAGPDGSVWFEPIHGNEWEGPAESTIGHLGADGSFAEVPTEGFAEPVIGPRGEVWVTLQIENGRNRSVRQIASLAPGGGIGTRFKVARGSGLIGPMAAGPRAVWFLQSHGRTRPTIERLTPADKRHEPVTALASNCESSGFAVTANETLWFSEACRHQGPYGYEIARASIVRLRPNGKLKRWKLAGGGDTMPVLLGRGGTVWVGASGKGGGAAIDRLSRDGSLAEYPVPDGRVASLALGADGRVWFRSTFGGGIVRALDWVAPGGKVGKPTCADPTCKLEPTFLTAAPDGTLWYGLATPASLGGGGFTHITEGDAILNEAGFVGRLVP